MNIGQSLKAERSIILDSMSGTCWQTARRATITSSDTRREIRKASDLDEIRAAGVLGDAQSGCRIE
jgi:hypothetical protein